MAKIILKWRYLKPGTRNHNQNLVKYIAKRDGVEKIDDSWKSLPVSVQQKKMIEQLLKDFPDAADSYEYQDYLHGPTQTSVYKGYKQDKIEMRGDRAEISDFPLYLNTVAGGLDCRDQTIGGFSFVVKIYAVPVVEIIG